MGNVVFRYPTLLAILLVGCHVASAQEPSGPIKRARTKADYIPRTLKQIKSGGTAASADSVTMLNPYAYLLPSRATLTFTGTTRPLQSARRRALRTWALNFAGSPDSYIARYNTEMLFLENGTKHWLAVTSDQVQQGLDQALRGTKVEVFLIRVGGPGKRAGGQYVLLVDGINGL